MFIFQWTEIIYSIFLIVSKDDHHYKEKQQINPMYCLKMRKIFGKLCITEVKWNSFQRDIRK